MKAFKSLILAAAAASAPLLFSACSSSPDDPGITVEYADDFEYLKRPVETSDAETRYKYAENVFDNVDFASIKDADLLRRLLGKPQATSENGMNRVMEYNYNSPSRGLTISAKFYCEGTKVVRTEIVKP